MSEGEPKVLNRPRDERDELAELEAKLARKRTEVEGYSNFGKYDGATVPNEGEVHYQGYLDQRPSEGIVRDGDNFREAHTGKFASESQYQQQNSENKILDMLQNPGEHAEDNFEEMGKMELVKRAAEAALIGDVAGVAEIRAAYEHNLMEEFTRDHTAGLEGAELDEEIRRQQGTDYSDEAFNAEMLDFDQKVAQLTESKKTAEGAALDVAPSAATEGGETETARINDEEVTAETGQGDEASNDTEAGTAESSEAENNDTPEASAERTGEPLYQSGDIVFIETENGPEQVTIGTAFMAADLSGEVIYRIVRADGTEDIVAEDDLSAPVVPGEEGSEVAADEGQSQEEYEADHAGGDQEAAEAHSGDGETEESVEQQDTARQKAVRGLKTLFAGPVAWAAWWETKKAIQRDVRSEMTPEEVEQQKKKNRIKYIAGGIGIFAAGVVTGALAMKGYIDVDQAHDVVKELAKGAGEQGAALGAEQGAVGGELPQLDWRIPNEFPINPGDGMTQGIQNALEAVGRDLTPDQYSDLHQYITNEYGPNYIINQGAPTNRMEVDAHSSFAPGVNEIIMKWMSANNIQ